MAQFLFKQVEEDGNGDYTTLEACLDANEQDLTGDGWFDIEICGTDLGGDGWDSADTTAATVNNYTTTADDYINIYTTASARHSGVWDNTKYRLVKTNDNCILIYTTALYTKVEGLQLQINETAGYGRTAISNPWVARYNLLVGEPDYVCTGILRNANFNVEAHIYNNIVYNFSINAAGSNYAGIRCDYDVVNVYNNTVYGCYYGISAIGHSGTDVIANNNLAYDNVVDFLGTITTNKFNASSSNNFSKDDTAIGDNSIHGDTDSKTPDFENVGGGTEDFHLQATSDAIDVGVSLAGIFTDDIDGDTRSGTWDIGADEYLSAVTDVTITPSVILLMGDVITPASISNWVNVTPATLDVEITLSSPAISGNANISPAVIDLTTSLLAPIITGDAAITASTISLALEVQAPVVSGNAIVTASIVEGRLVLNVATITGDALVSPSVVDLVTSLLTPSIYAYQPSLALDIILLKSLMEKRIVTTSEIGQLFRAKSRITKLVLNQSEMLKREVKESEVEKRILKEGYLHYKK